MHELSITQSILDIALRHAHKAGGLQIKTLYLVIGELSSIVDDSVQFYWDIISKGTLAEGSLLHFNRVQAQLLCQDCGNKYGLDEGLSCPLCDGIQTHILAGDESYLESIELIESPGKQQKFAGNSGGNHAKKNSHL